MAKIIKIDKFNKRRKKWEHFKLRFRFLMFRLNLLLNIGFILYYAHQNGYLTNIIEQVAPILESLLTKMFLLLGI